MASAIDLFRRDAKFFLTQGSVNIPIKMFNPNKSIEIDLTGWGDKHHLSFDTDGNQVNSKIVKITVTEKDLVDKGFSVRDANGNVNLLKYKVQFKDSSEVLRSFNVREVFPNENFGIIVLILERAII